jgi:DNA-binding MarR family transcriptional regulator
MARGAVDGAGDERRRQSIDALEGSFRELTDQLRRYYVLASEAVHPGMPVGTFKVLTAIARRGPLSQKSLAEGLAADKGLVSRQVSQLESLGLIARRHDAKDGRVRLLEASALGKARLSVAQGPIQDSITRALAAWPIASIEQLASLVHALADDMKPHDREPDECERS